jgi:hypothetical protein
MNTSVPEGWTKKSKYFKICDDSESETDSDLDSESDLDSRPEPEPVNVGMLNGYLNPKYYKEILVEEELLPD